MLARLIEHWLDNAGERRGYEIPFCQALVAQGHRILFRSSHGQLEQGKDIITVDHKGQYHAYQLKAGDLTLPVWRDIRGEVEELVGLPLEHPDIPENAPFSAHLVTSGILRDPARKTIKDWKKKWEQEGRRPLETVYKDALVKMFLDTHGEVLLATPADFERFLRLFLAEKRDVLSKPDFARFLESCLPFEREVKRSEMKRALSSAAVLASYVLQGYDRAGNHHALVEGWAMVVGYLLALLERYPLYLDHCRPSLDLCIAAWDGAAESLTKEALAATRWIEGDFIPDFAARGWRTTLLLGHMCTFALYRRAKGSAYAQEDEILDRVLKELKHVSFWGESAGPLCYSIMLFLWLRGQEGLACQWCGELAKLIGNFNGRRSQGPGVPDPYIDVQDLLKMRHLGENAFEHNETFRNRSFLLPILVEFLARRGRKRMLKLLWYDLCEVDPTEFTLDRMTDFYRWRATTGSIDSRRWPHPHQWSDLVAAAESPASPDTLLTRQFLPLLMPFLAVFPHRFTRRLARLAESCL